MAEDEKEAGGERKPEGEKPWLRLYLSGEDREVVSW